MTILVEMLVDWLARVLDPDRRRLRDRLRGGRAARAARRSEKHVHPAQRPPHLPTGQHPDPVGGSPRGVPEVEIRLRRSDAVVLLDWLTTTDLDAVPTTDPAQKQALADLLSRLETETDVPGATQGEIDAARREVARDKGW